MAYCASLRDLLAALLLSGVLIAAPGAAVGQESRAIESGSRVRIRLAQPRATWVRGKLLMVTPDSLRLVTPERRDTLAILGPTVARLQVSQGRRSNVRTGALIGAAIVAGAGVPLSIAVASTFNGDVDAGGVVAGTIFFAAGGAAVGALVGALVRTERWADVPRPWISMQSPNGPPGLELGFLWSW